MTAYQPGIPTGTVFLDLDYQNVQNNFQQLDTTYGTDHIAYSQAENNGFHTSVHLVPISTVASNPPNNNPATPPATTTGIGQLFSAQINDGINIDEALFFLTGGGRLLQLTRNFIPTSNSTNGYTFIGGFILQWGVVNGTHGGDNHFNGGDTNSVTFATNNIAFPSSCLNIWTSLAYVAGDAPSSSTNGTVSFETTFSKTGFTWSYNGTSASYTKFYWFAIGF
jgi:hypothetical protein